MAVDGSAIWPPTRRLQGGQQAGTPQLPELSDYGCASNDDCYLLRLCRKSALHVFVSRVQAGNSLTDFDGLQVPSSTLRLGLKPARIGVVVSNQSVHKILAAAAVFSLELAAAAAVLQQQQHPALQDTRMRTALLTICICWIAAGTFAYRVYDNSQLHLTRQLQGNDENSCEHPQLVLVDEEPFRDMFDDPKGLTKFEGSALAVVQGKAWVGFDNSFALARLRTDLDISSSSSSNDAPALIGDPGDDSQYEALTYDSSTGRLLAVVEGVKTATGIQPYVHELQVSASSSDYKVVQKCPVNFELESDNKGFEGAHVFYGNDGSRYLIGLCEGNFCSSGDKGRQPGNGRLVVTKFNGKAAGDGCAWDYVKTVNIPAEVAFQDYSDLAFAGNQAAITSQASSLLWLGSFDFDTFAFAPSRGEVFQFPRPSKCNIKYCSVEGIAFLGDGHLLVVSDKDKKSQPDRCQERDQRISTFKLPE